MKTRYCLDCETKLTGRADQKFCGDACRNNYNNRLNSDNTFMRKINNVLRKNRRILVELIITDDGKATVPSKKLVDKGFNFEYFTHILNTKTGNTYYFCYDYGYRKLDEDYFLLVKKT